MENNEHNNIILQDSIIEYALCINDALHSVFMEPRETIYFIFLWISLHNFHKHIFSSILELKTSEPH